jgi:hypothetical protein
LRPATKRRKAGKVPTTELRNVRGAKVEAATQSRSLQVYALSLVAAGTAKLGMQSGQCRF